MKAITLTANTLQAIADARLPGTAWINTATANSDGTYSVLVDDDVMEALEELGPDYEATILQLLGKYHA